MDSHHSSEDEYEEIEEEMLDIKCLFCEAHATTFERIFDHITEMHQLDFVTKCKSCTLDAFQFIKLINYIRKTQIPPSEVEEVLASKLYDSDSFLKPALEDDHLLMFDFEDDDADDNSAVANQGDDNNFMGLKDFNQFESFYRSIPKEKVIEDFFALKCKYEECQNGASKMGQFIQDTMQDDVTQMPDGISNVMKLDEKSDSGYINSYSNVGIHHVMLSDRPRTLAYRTAILDNSALFRGKTVLDIGCGTGILSLFAAQAGASIVVAIDQSDFIYNAMGIIRQNGYENVIKTVKGKLENIDFAALSLPLKYDIIISEWMGYFLLFEGMIDTVIFARDRLMKSEGKLLPDKSKIYLAAFTDAEYFGRNVQFWKDVYGFDMSCLAEEATSEASVDLIEPQRICSSTAQVCRIDLEQCSLESVLQVCSPFELQFAEQASVHGFVGWFDCFFDTLPLPTMLSTSPLSEATHWKQTIFLLKDPLLVSAGGKLSGTIQITRNNSNARALIVKIDVSEHNLSLEYGMS